MTAKILDEWSFNSSDDDENVLIGADDAALVELADLLLATTRRFVERHHRRLHRGMFQIAGLHPLPTTAAGEDAIRT